jgi:hypothetical protein
MSREECLPAFKLGSVLGLVWLAVFAMNNYQNNDEQTK